MMEIKDLNLYTVLITGLLIVTVINRFRRFLRPPWILQCLTYPLIFVRGRWTANGMTRLEALLVASYITTNVAFVVLSVKGLLGGIAELSKYALLNMVLLFLNRKSSPIADFFGIPLNAYYLAHHWAGRIATSQGATHSAYAWRTANTLQRVSGSVLCGSMVLSCIVSSWLIRKRLGLFSLVHYTLALGILGTLIWHVYESSRPRASLSWVLIYCIALLCIATRMFYLCRRVWYHPCKILTVENLGQIARVRVRCRRRVSPYPQMYFYLFSSSVLRFQSQMAPVVWWDPRNTRELTFLVDGGFANTLSNGVILDGPYGNDIDSSQYDTVMLVADGIGISGVLSFALSLVSRRHHDKTEKAAQHFTDLFRDRTRKVNIYWRVNSFRDVEWVTTPFQSLDGVGEGKVGFGPLHTNPN